MPSAAFVGASFSRMFYCINLHQCNLKTKCEAKSVQAGMSLFINMLLALLQYHWQIA